MVLFLLTSFPAWSVQPPHPGELQVAIAWKGREAELLLLPPPGEHVAPGAPLVVEVDWDGRAARWELFGEDAGELELRLGTGARHRVEGRVRVSLCEDAGSRCRVVERPFGGEVRGRRGRAILAEPAPPGPGDREAPARADRGGADPFAEAAAGGRLVLLDFSARWCPPCNRLAAELLDAPEPDPVLDAYVVRVVDADLPASFALKDRYHVGGYPTLLVADPAGREIGRLVGYPGREAVVAWLDELAARPEPLEELAARAAELAPEEAAHLAFLAAVGGREDLVGRFLAGADLDRADARIARLRVQPGGEDLSWLARRAPDRLGDWMWSALDVALPDPLPPELVDALAGGITSGDPLQAADAAAVAGLLGPGEAGSRLLLLAAAALLETTLTGDPVRDRGAVLDLLDLWDEGGAHDRAIAEARRFYARFPHDWTFAAWTARLLRDAGRTEEALGWARAAAALAVGDQRYRSALLLGGLLRDLGQRPEAVEVLEGALREGPDPGARDVRTHRYREQVRSLLAELEEASP